LKGRCGVVGRLASAAWVHEGEFSAALGAMRLMCRMDP
jgi:hypothetical protein